MEYRSATRRYRYTTPEQRTADIDLTPAGRVARITVDGLAPMEYSYDARGRLTTAAMGVGANRRATTFTYDANGYLHTVSDPLDRLTTLTNDRLGRTTTQEMPDLRTIAYRYRPGGQITGLTPPGRPEHQFQWDRLNQLTVYDPPMLSAAPRVDTRFAYNADRQLTDVDRPDGLLVELDYNEQSGLLASASDSLSELVLERDNVGRIERATTPGWTVLRNWRSGGLPASESQGPGGLVWRFDSNYWLTRIVVGMATSSLRTDYTYDRDGLLINARVFDNASSQLASMRVLRRPDNGLLLGTEVGEVSDDWDYNAFAEPDSHNAVAASAVVYRVDYTRDKLGRIVGAVETIGSSTAARVFRYDSAGRLDQVTVDGTPAARYAFDSNGNRTRATYGDGPSAMVIDATYDAQDRLLTYGDYRYTWTANGDLATRTHQPTGAMLTTVYDSFGNLRQATLPDSRVIDYTTDAFHRRVEKRVDGVLRAQYLYVNTLEPIAVLDASGQEIASFVYAERAHTPSLMRKSGRVYRLIADQVGSVRLVIDVANGQIAQRIDYDEFGRMIVDTNPGFQPFGFAGGVFDEDTGLIRFGARDYDPSTGRWTAKDAKRFTTGAHNLYIYVSGDPINLIDVDGYAEVCSRPLDVFPLNLGKLRHDQIWYEDGSNSGFFPEGVREDKVDPANPSSPSREKSEYSNCKYIGPDALVREAEFRVQENLSNYNLASNNCQGYVDAVIKDEGLINERIAPVGESRIKY